MEVLFFFLLTLYQIRPPSTKQYFLKAAQNVGSISTDSAAYSTLQLAWTTLTWKTVR